MFEWIEDRMDALGFEPAGRMPHPLTVVVCIAVVTGFWSCVGGAVIFATLWLIRQWQIAAGMGRRCLHPTQWRQS